MYDDNFVVIKIFDFDFDFDELTEISRTSIGIRARISNYILVNNGL